MRDYTVEFSNGEVHTLQAKHDNSALGKANKIAIRRQTGLDVIYDTSDMSVEDGAPIVWQI
jgi:hypothetical protein